MRRILCRRLKRSALQRAQRALAEFRIEGVPTVLPLLRAVLRENKFTAAEASGFQVYTRWIDDELSELSERARRYVDVEVGRGTSTAAHRPAAQSDANDAEVASYRVGIKAPLSGLVLELRVQEGDMVAVGDIVAIMESMKMEQSIVAEVAGAVAKVNVSVGAFIDGGADLMGLN
ncbi:acyl-CoA carboxylase biotin carboxyl carrier protein subunit [Sinorhizobium fredii]|uniref:acetyl-CoA carboxylase biotin carboxyl carrier protein subunit n=1 Tax=Rhizobium fredii TaxID=380 RepID=UPI000AF2D278|nr:acetyl-CoA carboxylase biotin carboxyl carrier protein subunit [Sinorhizobium fredii]WOS64660.1 biotin/lipoyl-containing protein [Sinorhizobium fredii GR64]